MKTLSSRVNKQIKESLYQNEVFKSSRWNPAEQIIVLLSTYYKKSILIAFLLAVLVTTNLILWQPLLKPYVVQHIPDWSELPDWQGTFLAGQLTIIGVVYPLVVGLISVLFQNKSAKKIIFPLYQTYSGFMFAGLSGLALSGFIVVGFSLSAVISDSSYTAISITSALWFLINLLLTAWFFVKTFRMLDDTSREEIVFKFSIQEACEFDVRHRIRKALLEHAVSNKLLVNPDKQVMEVVTYKHSSEDYGNITRKVKRDKSLKDVRLSLLNFAIWIQVFILKLKKIQGGKLVVQPVRNSKTSSVYIVARYSGFKINPVVKALIGSAFSFEKEASQARVGLSNVLKGFIGPANDAIRDGDAREFSDAMKNLAMWHSELAEALSFKNDEGNLDNWLILSDGSLWGKNYLDELMGEYYRLARETAERIPDNSSFYTDMLNFYRSIFSRRNTLINQEIRSLIQGSYYMWYLLVEWRSYNSGSSDLRIANKYEHILYSFVGAWENWLMCIPPRSKKTVDINKAYPVFITHLEFTASTPISALRFGNFEAAGWGVDMLNNWLDQLSRDNHWHAEFSWSSALINHSLLSMEPTSNTWQSILKGNNYDYSVAFDLSLKNAHVDLRVITACYMLLKPSDDKSDLLTKYVKDLLSGVRIHPSGSIGQSPHVISSAGQLLGAYIRHRDYRYLGEKGYGSWLASILKSFGRINAEKLVPGRIYSGWEEENLRSMNRAYVEIAISMSGSIWQLPNDWEEALFSDFFRYTDRQSFISDLHDWIKIANEERDYLLVDSNSLATLKANFIKSVEGIIHKINDTQRQLVANVDIDQEQLTKLGVASSATLSGKGGPGFPLELFENLYRDVELDDNYSLGVDIVDYAKERVASGIDTNQVIDEDSWMADRISKDLRRNVLLSLLKYPQSESYEYTDIDSTFSSIRKTSELMACPVLFVGSQDQEVKSTLDRSLYEPEIADKYDISRQDGFDKDYICHIGNCEVYLLRFSDIDYCLLTSKELFESVSFRKIADDQYVDVAFELDEGSDTAGRLALKYWMKVDLADTTPCIKLGLVMNDNKSE